MKILITGVHGFVGSNLVEYLKAENEIYGLDIIDPEKDGVVRTFVNILAVRRVDEFFVSPRADFKFAEGDSVVMLGDSAALKKVQKL